MPKRVIIRPCLEAKQLAYWIPKLERFDELCLPNPLWVVTVTSVLARMGKEGISVSYRDRDVDSAGNLMICRLCGQQEVRGGFCDSCRDAHKQTCPARYVHFKPADRHAIGQYLGIELRGGACNCGGNELFSTIRDVSHAMRL